ncbi:MAG: hypothetical protein P8X86_15635, partial [Desulfofustis sp.]
QRQQLVDEFSGRGLLFFVHCHCAESVIKDRFQLRAADSKAVSDGRWEIYQGQKKVFVVPTQVAGALLLDLDTDDRIEALLARVDDFVDGG